MSTEGNTEEATNKKSAQTGETVVMTMDSPTPGNEPARGEMSATTVARMMGLATAGEMKLLEGKVDLLMTKLNAMQVRVEKVVTLLTNVPSGADLERIDVQIGALRQLIREALSGQPLSAEDKTAGGDAAKKPGAKIVTNTTPTNS